MPETRSPDKPPTATTGAPNAIATLPGNHHWRSKTTGPTDQQATPGEREPSRPGTREGPGPRSIKAPTGHKGSMRLCLLMSQRDEIAGGHSPSYAVAICKAAIEAGCYVSLCSSPTFCRRVSDDLRYLSLERSVTMHQETSKQTHASRSARPPLLLDQLHVYRDLERLWRDYSRQDSADWVHLLNGGDCSLAVAAMGSPCGSVPVSLVLFSDYLSSTHGEFSGATGAAHRTIRAAGLWALLHQRTVGHVFSTNPLMGRAWKSRPRSYGTNLSFIQEMGPNWASLPSKAAARASLHIPSDSYVVLCYGMIGARKRVDYLLDILTQDRSGRLLALLVGPIAPECESILNQARSRALQRDQKLVVVPGYSNLAVETLAFGATDATWVVYREFLGPSAVLELACAAGTPLIGSGAGVIGDTIQREHLGALVRGAAPEQDYEEIRRLMNDGELHASAARACLSHAARNGGAGLGHEICSGILATLQARKTKTPLDGIL